MSNLTLQRNHSTGPFWSMRREATLNWLALGLLLAAWNASDRAAPARDASARDASARDASADALRKPLALRGYSHISVRAANRVAGIGR
jgi:hypothetical protein